jgi:hypothetical protein
MSSLDEDLPSNVDVPVVCFVSALNIESNINWLV